MGHESRLRGPLLDVGWGTGESALFLADWGYEVVGVDAAPRAVERAREKARERDIAVEFAVHDTLALPTLDRRFATVVDSGLFHVFDDADRARYVESLAGVLVPGGTVRLVCFSDHEPGEWGPRRVSETDFSAAFTDG